MNEIVAYECEYCGRKYFSKSGVVGHEKICWNNPVNERCGSCMVCDGNFCSLHIIGVDHSGTCDRWCNGYV